MEAPCELLDGSAVLSASQLYLVPVVVLLLTDRVVWKSFKDASSNDLNKTKVSSSKQKPLFPCQSPRSLPGLQLAGKCFLQPGQNQPFSRPLTGSVGL